MRPILSCAKCDYGWICEEHPDQPFPHDNCAGPAMPCDEPTCPYRIDTRPVSLAYDRVTGANVEGQAFFYVAELEQVIRECVGQVYHSTKHDGLCLPGPAGFAFGCSPLTAIWSCAARFSTWSYDPNLQHTRPQPRAPRS